jgi:hypothetical protein
MYEIETEYMNKLQRRLNSLSWSVFIGWLICLPVIIFTSLVYFDVISLGEMGGIIFMPLGLLIGIVGPITCILLSIQIYYMYISTKYLNNVDLTYSKITTAIVTMTLIYVISVSGYFYNQKRIRIQNDLALSQMMTEEYNTGYNHFLSSKHEMKKYNYFVSEIKKPRKFQSAWITNASFRTYQVYIQTDSNTLIESNLTLPLDESGSNLMKVVQDLSLKNNISYKYIGEYITIPVPTKQEYFDSLRKAFTSRENRIGYYYTTSNGTRHLDIILTFPVYIKEKQIDYTFFIN